MTNRQLLQLKRRYMAEGYKKAIKESNERETLQSDYDYERAGQYMDYIKNSLSYLVDIVDDYKDGLSKKKEHWDPRNIMRTLISKIEKEAEQIRNRAKLNDFI